MVRTRSITLSLMGLAFGCILVAASPLLAQVEFGGLYGGVSDSDGTPLRGNSLGLSVFFNF